MPEIDRRGFVGGLGGLAAGASLLATARPAPPGAAAEPVFHYDLTHLYTLDLADPEQAARAYDELHFVSTLQGIVNRDHPRLYVHFVDHSEFGTKDIDDYWLAVLRRDGGLLADRPLRHLGTLEDLVTTFRRSLRGAVVWDPNVPATSDVASTVAGARDLVAVRYDPSPDSLYTRYVGIRDAADGPLRLPAVVRLVRDDGSSLFTGRGPIPGTRRESTGSAKCDAYVWAVEHYLRTGRSTPDLGYYLDGYWLCRPQGKLQQALLTNHDYLVSRRGFFFDLLPWDDEAPVDDPNQPVGTDQATLEEILRVAYERAGGAMVPVHGFVPWGYKYTTVDPAGGHHEPVATEWRFVQVASAYNAYLDADAENLDAMANASVFRHAPLRSAYPQRPRPTTADLRARGFVDASGAVAPRRYVMFYVGDYDSAAWLYQVMPYVWDDAARGKVPLNWAFNPNLAERMPVALDLARRTATSADTFVAGDSGAGYVNPGMLAEPREFSGLPSGVAAWRRHCRPRYARWDLTVTGFVIDGYAPGMDAETRAAYADFSPDGFAAQKIEPMGLVGTTPFVRMGPDLPRADPATAARALRDALDGDLAGPPAAPRFLCVRTILESPSWHREVVDMVLAQAREAAVELVDAHTFYALVRQHLG
ncbi:GxGYxYP domain-containing protein [Actinopolymorpha singaporensis]|uniref:GxGYxY sequence motif-containing protein n=1 Tax=Actinopolymorpha singaporensis TaxID=117157 RepID=A0A1H1XY53_9ACTN|nr:GxGYxYP domain-containing protein [Actinopolymorpha singaporensis]SDT14103.1 GxGYxY sequence motif-containing protein [Actinopolymorpha singaporensis]